MSLHFANMLSSHTHIHTHTYAQGIMIIHSAAEGNHLTDDYPIASSSRYSFATDPDDEPSLHKSDCIPPNSHYVFHLTGDDILWRV